jgi:hypothetical protein
MMSAHYRVPNYVSFSTCLLLILPHSKIFSTPLTRTLSIHVLPLVRETKFHTHAQNNRINDSFVNIYFVWGLRDHVFAASTSTVICRLCSELAHFTSGISRQYHSSNIPYSYSIHLPITSSNLGNCSIIQ